MLHHSTLQPSRICNPLRRMEIRFDGAQNPGGLLTVNGARFGMTRNGGTRPHQGVDLYAVPGTRIFSVASGEVVRLRHHDRNYGQEIMIRFRPDGRLATFLRLGEGADLFVLYAHLSDIRVSLGPVRYGQPLGETGISGNADQRYPHLHLEIRTRKDAGFGLGNRLNPEHIFRGIDYSRPVEALELRARTA